MKKITTETKDTILNNTAKVVVKFGATWCGPCRSYDQAIASLDADNIEFYSCDVDSNAHWVSSLSIRGIPATILFENGVETKRLTGVQTPNTIIELLS